MQRKIYCVVRKQSRRRIEIKLFYPLGTRDKKALQVSDFYLFFPAHLMVNQRRIGVEGFFNTLQVNTRFSSPLIPLEKVVDKGVDLSPLTRIQRLLTSPRFNVARPEDRQGIIYELQTLCNLYRAEIRGFVELTERLSLRGQSHSSLEERAVKMVESTRVFLKELRKLHPLFLDNRVDDDLRTALYWADEQISIVTENAYIRLCETFKSQEIEFLLDQEEKHRKAMNYLYHYTPEDPLSGETMAYRESILKKWSQSAMYMNCQESQTPKRIGHLVAAAAAGLAMLLALFISIYADTIFPKNSSLWIILIVLSYMLKDRIKETLRDSFGSFLPQFVRGQQTILVDPARNRRVGRSSGTVRFIKARQAPPEIRRIRYSQPNPFRSFLPQEDVIHYRRTTALKGHKLLKYHSRLRGVNEVLRFQVDEWLKMMDDPRNTLYTQQEGNRVEIRGQRVYRMNLVASLRPQREEEEHLHYRIILNSKGIVRVEKERLK